MCLTFFSDHITTLRAQTATDTLPAATVYTAGKVAHLLIGSRGVIAISASISV